MEYIIVGVRFRKGQKVYYFDPKDIEFSEGDGVVVETARGVEYGTVVLTNRAVDEKEVVSPLKPVMRKATEKDAQQNKKNLSDRPEVLEIANKKVEERGLSMKIVDAEYTFDRAKLIISFTADSRVDFRELVKDLAQAFHLRIELRQIYERDDIQMRGALASCGRPCCCTTHLQDYDKVSIKMAKAQGLSLNPTKISGCCGKLMCCLRYEYPYYQEVSKKMPKHNAHIKTTQGDGQVVGQDMLKQTVRIRMFDEDGAMRFADVGLDEIILPEPQKPCPRPCPKSADTQKDAPTPPAEDGDESDQ